MGSKITCFFSSQKLWDCTEAQNKINKEYFVLYIMQSLSSLELEMNLVGHF